MKHSKLMSVALVAGLTLGAQVSVAESEQGAKEEPVQHLKIAEVTTADEAKKIFVEKTAEIKAKTKLDVKELHDIHFITYTLEQSIAYYTRNLTGERQKLAEEMAVVVEEIHIASEKNRRVAAKVHLAKYFEMADRFAVGL